MGYYATKKMDWLPKVLMEVSQLGIDLFKIEFENNVQDHGYNVRAWFGSGAYLVMPIPEFLLHTFVNGEEHADFAGGIKKLMDYITRHTEDSQPFLGSAKVAFKYVKLGGPDHGELVEFDSLNEYPNEGYSFHTVEGVQEASHKVFNALIHDSLPPDQWGVMADMALSEFIGMRVQVGYYQYWLQARSKLCGD